MGNAAVVARFGDVEIDLPRAVGFYGDIVTSVMLEVIEPPLGLFLSLLPMGAGLARRSAQRRFTPGFHRTSRPMASGGHGASGARSHH